MKWLNCSKIRVMLVGAVAAMVLVGGNAQAEIIMSEPTNVGPVINDAYDVQECDFLHDGLELYFSAHRPDEYGKRDIYVARRETINDPWQEPVNLGPNVNSSGSQVEPSISGNGLELYFGCWDDWNLRVCTRPSKDAPWSSPVKVGPPVGSYEPAMEIGSNDVWGPDISADGLSLYFNSTRVGGYGGNDIWVAKRATIDDEWGEPVNLGPNVNSAGGDNEPCISTDGLTLVFNRGLRNMMASTRKFINDDWGPAVDLGFPAPGNFYGPALSPDGSTIYFDAAAPWGGYGDNDIWQINFIPIVDFNSDEIVDIADLVALIEHWGQEDPLCDIGPLPLGDGIVDEADLEVFMTHWGQEAYDPTLIAYWKLDETEGDIAYNSISDNYGIISGNPTWQPDSGQLAGALEFDGIDDYISTDFVLNPSDSPFSIFAWIKGDAPGQVIISQTGGANWLSADPSEGNLMTELVPPTTRSPLPPLVSETVITDSNWHHIGFVRSGASRMLYVDGVLAAEDVQNNLAGSSNGLYIGAGKNLEAGTFFSGLIDDVRIYNVALNAEQIAAMAQ
jgi:hypothetical protein